MPRHGSERHFILYSYEEYALGLLAPGATHFSGEVAIILLFAVPSIVAGLAVYRWIEAPINNALRRQLKLRNARMQPVVP
jgi:peptidoglycan/LPS O-acetylase OafA/YrhL